MNKRSVPRRSLAGLAFILALGLLLVFAVPALADYLGPNRTVSVWQWERLQCHYEAVYDPPDGPWVGCTLELYASPDSGCPSTSSVAGYFTPSACGWAQAWCQTEGCDISVSSSTVGCSEGEPGCTAVEHFTTLPEASINGSVSCGVPGYSGWCLSSAALSLSGNEPLSGYSILALEGSRNGDTFACPGDNCAVPIPEGTSDFTYWAISSWGDTSRMGAASGRLDTQPPAISGSISGVAGDNGWYLSDVTFTASASDASPGSGLSSLDLSLDGGGWSAYTGPLVLSGGSHAVDLRAADAAGNVGAHSQAVRVDTLPPTLALSAGGSFCPGCGHALDVTIDVQDSLSGVAEWILSADGTQIASGTAPASQTLTWNGSGLPGGAHTLTLFAQDAAGNVQERNQAVTLLVPPPPQASSTPSHPGWTPFASSPTSTSIAGQMPTRTSRPTSTASVSGFGGPPVAPAEGSPEPGSSLDGENAPPPAVEGPSSGVLWGAGALALIGAATALALDAARKRKEEEERLRAEMEARNAAQRAKEEAERERLRAAAAATAAAWVAERRAQEWQEEQSAERYAGREQALERRQAARDWQRRQEAEAARRAEAARLAAAAAAAESLRRAAQAREEAARAAEAPWWQRALDWVDQHQALVAVGIGVVAGAAAVLLTGGIAAPLVVGALAAGATTALGTVGLNAYYDRPLGTNLLRNVGLSAGAAVLSSGVGLTIRSGLALRAAFGIGNGAAALCGRFPEACGRAEAALRFMDTVEQAALQVQLAIQTAMGDPSAADTAFELQMEQMDGGLPGNSLAREVNEQVSEAVSEHIDEAAELVERYDPLSHWDYENLAVFGDELADRIVPDATALDAGSRLVTLFNEGPLDLNSPQARELIDTIAENSIQGSGDLMILGRWTQSRRTGYVGDAGLLDGTYFETNPGLRDVFEAMPADTRREVFWAINERVLEMQEASGMNFVHTLRGLRPEDALADASAIDLLALGEPTAALHSLQDVDLATNALPFRMLEAQWLLEHGYIYEVDLESQLIRWLHP